MRFQAILNIHENVGVINGEGENEQVFDKDGNQIKIDETKVSEEVKRLQADYEANQYQRDRKLEYPSIQELVVALYDADDKAEIDKKRAEIKKKYPKPE